MTLRIVLFITFALAQAANCTFAAEPVAIDFSKPVGTICALHHANHGPVNEGETVYWSKTRKEAAIPLARHGAEWPAKKP